MGDIISTSSFGTVLRISNNTSTEAVRGPPRQYGVLQLKDPVAKSSVNYVLRHLGWAHKSIQKHSCFNSRGHVNNHIVTGIESDFGHSKVKGSLRKPRDKSGIKAFCEILAPEQPLKADVCTIYSRASCIFNI